MTIDQHIQQLQFQFIVISVLMCLLMLATFGAVLALLTKDEEVPAGDRARRERRAAQAQAKKDAEEKALNDAIEAAVNKLIQGNQP